MKAVAGGVDESSNLQGAEPSSRMAAGKNLALVLSDPFSADVEPIVLDAVTRWSGMPALKDRVGALKWLEKELDFESELERLPPAIHEPIDAWRSPFGPLPIAI